MAIAERDAGREVVGIDLSERMLGVAAGKIASKGIGNVELRKMDAADVAFPDASFDVVTTSLSLHELPEGLRSSVVAEMRRLVSENGRLMVIEWEAPPSGPARALFRVFPGLFEPRGFREFLAMDWRD